MPKSRTFAYVRVSTLGQTTDNQIQEIRAAGFKIEPRRVVTETISGSVATAQRRGFTRLLDRLEPGDVLIVTKLDRLGRNAMDVSSTVAKLAGIGVRVHCLALGGVDLASSTGKLTMHVINAVAEFERDLLIERTQAGLNRAKAEGKTLGRPTSLNDDQRRDVAQRLKDGAGASELSRAFKTSRQTIMRIRDGVLGVVHFRQFWGNKRACGSGRPLRVGLGQWGCCAGEAVSLSGSGALVLKRSEAEQSEPVRMAFAGHQFPWALALAFSTSAAHEATMVQKELK